MQAEYLKPKKKTHETGLASSTGIFLLIDPPFPNSGYPCMDDAATCSMFSSV